MTGISNTAPVSIAASSSAAAAGGSVINVSSLVSQLVAVAQAPQQSLIANQTGAVTTQISALGTLKSALSTFQSSLSALATPSAFNSQTATSNNQSAFTATAGSGAASGTYSITVSQLAQGQQLLSSAFAGGGSATTGTGTLSIAVGSSSFNVTVDSTDNTLSGLAAAINSATGNPGITATVLQGSDGGHLVLTSSLTGAANTIQVNETDGGTSLSNLTYGSGNTANYTQQAAALDAQFSVAGVNSTSPSNTVTSAITGVSLTLVGKTQAGTPATLTVGSDTSTVQANISKFVSAYNTLAQTFSSLGSFDSTSNTAGPMLGNPILTGIESEVRGALNSIVTTGSSTYNTLASVGITSNSDGTLSVDTTALSNALSSNFGAVSQLFSSKSGIAASLNSQISDALGSNGFITDAAQSLTKQSDALTQKSKDLSTQMASLQASLTTQFTSLNTLLSSLQTTSAYLSQALSSLPNVQTSSSNG
jgi:flagellar hook-associated protein 2